jgi:hypothetical protein
VWALGAQAGTWKSWRGSGWVWGARAGTWTSWRGPWLKDRNIENESFVQCLELKVHLRAFFDILSNLGNSYPDYDLATARALLVKH